MQVWRLPPWPLPTDTTCRTDPAWNANSTSLRPCLRNASREQNQRWGNRGRPGTPAFETRGSNPWFVLSRRLHVEVRSPATRPATGACFLRCLWKTACWIMDLSASWAGRGVRSWSTMGRPLCAWVSPIRLRQAMATTMRFRKFRASVSLFSPRAESSKLAYGPREVRNYQPKHYPRVGIRSWSCLVSRSGSGTCSMQGVRQATPIAMPRW